MKNAFVPCEYIEVNAGDAAIPTLPLKVDINESPRAISGSKDYTMRVWDLETGICMHILEGHSSHAEVESVVGKGSTFSFKLPRVKGDDEKE